MNDQIQDKLYYISLSTIQNQGFKTKGLRHGFPQKGPSLNQSFEGLDLNTYLGKMVGRLCENDGS